MQEWLKTAQFMLEKLRLRTSSLRIQQAKLKSQLVQKEELGECIHEVDFEKLKIDRPMIFFFSSFMPYFHLITIECPVCLYFRPSCFQQVNVFIPFNLNLDSSTSKMTILYVYDVVNTL